jgi:streptomycin 6-kinase
MPLSIPTNLVEAAGRKGRQAWVASLPATVTMLSERWSLDVGEPFQPGGQTSWVAPVHGEDYGEVVLKVARRHPEADHEAGGLRTWNGV